MNERDTKPTEEMLELINKMVDWFRKRKYTDEPIDMKFKGNVFSLVRGEMFVCLTAYKDGISMWYGYERNKNNYTMFDGKVTNMDDFEAVMRCVDR